MEKKYIKTIAFDFDGVIHKYRKGWKDGSIYDELDFNILRIMNYFVKHDDYNVIIMTTRSRFQIKKHFDFENNAPAPDTIPFKYKTFGLFRKFWNKNKIVGITNKKVPCYVLIDDRAMRFNPKNSIEIEDIINFKPKKYK